MFGHNGQDETRMIRVGLFFLIAGALSLRFLHARLGMDPDLADGVTGLFYGLAIGCMLAGLRARSRRRG
ncbi:MAG TPA: hypothetical protein VF363_01335 [Candidatus Eisenbacteria bacterium]